MHKIFIHIPKTGGFALNKELLGKGIIKQPQKHHLDENYLTGLIKNAKLLNRSPQVGHCRWKDLKEDYRGAHVAFAIIRNPWSKLVSQFLFGQKVYRTGKLGNNPPVTDKTTFEEFLTLRASRVNDEYNWHRTMGAFCQQIDHVTDNDRNIKCDILRFEQYDVDTIKYLNLSSPIGKRNVSNVNNLDYKDFYNEGTKEMVSQWYKDDIEFFGFSFEGTSTKNIWNK